MLLILLAAFAETPGSRVPDTVAEVPENPTRGAVYTSVLSLAAAVLPRRSVEGPRAPVRIGVVDEPLERRPPDPKLPTRRSISNGMVRAPVR